LWGPRVSQFDDLLRAHLEAPRAGRPPQAPALEPVNRLDFEAAHTAKALTGIPWYRRYDRRVGRELARYTAGNQAAAEIRRREAAQAEKQAQLDREWQRLESNEPPVVTDAVRHSLEALPWTARVLGVTGDRADLVIVFGSLEELVPERKAGYTPTGRPSSKKMTKTERNSFYVEALASVTVASARRAFAAAPGLRHIASLAVREALDADAIEPVSYALISRPALGRSSRESAAEVLTGGGTYEVERKGRTGEVVPLAIQASHPAQDLARKASSTLSRPFVQLTLPSVRKNAEAATSRGTPREAGAKIRVEPRAPRQSRTKSEDPDVRRRAVERLAAKGGEAAVEGLIEALSDANADVRWEAAFGLRGVHNDTVVGPLSRALSDADSGVRVQVAGALAALQSESALPSLLKAVKDSNADVRFEAVYGLGELRHPQAQQALQVAREDSDKGVREAAETFLDYAED